RALAEPGTQYFLLREGEEFAGYAKLCQRQELPACLQGREGIYLERLYLLRQFQGRGYGSKLLARVYEEARTLGFRWLWLSVWEHNLGAIRFYEKLGFTRAGEWAWTYESLGRSYADRDYIMTIAVPAL